MEGRRRRTRKDVVGCFQDAVGKKKFLLQLEDVHKKRISSSSLVFLVWKERLRWMSHYLILQKMNTVNC